MTKEILERIDAIGAKLGVAAGHLYGVLVRQATVDAWRDMILAGVFGVFVGVCAWLVKKSIKEEFGHHDDGFIAFVSGIVGVGLAILMFVFAYTSVGEFMNPEFYAIHNILDALKPAAK